MAILRLPSTVYDDSLSDLLAQLGLVAKQEQEPIEVDFQDMQFYVPAGLVILLTAVHGWVRQKHEVRFINLNACPILAYLQRMDFFAMSGVKLTEAFVRHESKGRFMPLCLVSSGTAGKVPEMCRELANCVFPELADSDNPEETGPYDMLEFAASELINNVIQHAQGPGYVAAQVYPVSGLIRLAIADCGVGVRQSFANYQPPFWDPKMSHLDAVRTALQPRISSKLHLGSAWGEAVNAGVGLSILKEVARHADGLFTLISGTGLYQHNHQERRRFPTEINLLENYQGTICAMQLSKQKLGNLQQILQDAKKGIGLLQPDQRFNQLFQ